MKSKFFTIFWAVVLIAAGVVFLQRELGWINFDVVSSLVWALLFGAFGIFFVLTFISQGMQAWGWLFPGTIFLGISLIIWLEGTALGQVLSGAPVLAGVAIPFIVAYAGDPKTRQWALIPAWVLSVLTLVVLIERFVSGNLIGAMVLYSIALPFLFIFLQDRTRRWALIPAGVLAIVGTIPLLELFLVGQAFDFLVLALIAIPFYVVFFMNRQNWWALIPAGVFTSIVLALLVEAITGMPFQAGILLAGFALTFGVLWLLRREQSTDWAKFPALGLFIAATIVFFTENRANIVGPFILILAGVVVLLSNLVRRKPKEEAEKKDLE